MRNKYMKKRKTQLIQQTKNTFSNWQLAIICEQRFLCLFIYLDISADFVVFSTYQSSFHSDHSYSDPIHSGKMPTTKTRLPLFSDESLHYLQENTHSRNTKKKNNNKVEKFTIQYVEHSHKHGRTRSQGPCTQVKKMEGKNTFTMSHS